MTRRCDEYAFFAPGVPTLVAKDIEVKATAEHWAEMDARCETLTFFVRDPECGSQHSGQWVDPATVVRRAKPVTPERLEAIRGQLIVARMDQLFTDGHLDKILWRDALVAGDPFTVRVVRVEGNREYTLAPPDDDDVRPDHVVG